MASKKLPEIIELKPFKLKIGGLTWQVVFEETLKDDEGNPLCGICDADRLKITIQKNMIMENTKITFFHEWSHGLLSGISNGNDKIDEEHIAELTGRAINELFAQRKRLPVWIFEGVS